MTENEVLCMVAESGIWIPKRVRLALNSPYLSFFFMLAIACLEQLSQVFARAAVSTFV